MAHPDIRPGGGATQINVEKVQNLCSGIPAGQELPEDKMSLDEAIKLAKELGLAVTPGANGKIWFRLGDLVV